MPDRDFEDSSVRKGKEVMLKEDVKIEKWSSMRGLDRTETPMAFRFSPAERNAIETEAAQRMVRPSDVVRGSLIYAGVIPEPKPDEVENLNGALPTEASEAVQR